MQDKHLRTSCAARASKRTDRYSPVGGAARRAMSSVPAMFNPCALSQRRAARPPRRVRRIKMVQRHASSARALIPASIAANDDSGGFPFLRWSADIRRVDQVIGHPRFVNLGKRRSAATSRALPGPVAAVQSAVSSGSMSCTGSAFAKSSMSDCLARLLRYACFANKSPPLL